MQHFVIKFSNNSFKKNIYAILLKQKTVIGICLQRFSLYLNLPIISENISISL